MSRVYNIQPVIEGFNDIYLFRYASDISIVGTLMGEKDFMIYTPEKGYSIRFPSEVGFSTKGGIKVVPFNNGLTEIQEIFPIRYDDLMFKSTHPHGGYTATTSLKLIYIKSMVPIESWPHVYQLICDLHFNGIDIVKEGLL